MRTSNLRQNSEKVTIESVTRSKVGVRFEAGVSPGTQMHVWEITSFASIVVKHHLTKLRFFFNVATKLNNRPEVNKSLWQQSTRTQRG